jgi:hypothetical protein
MQPLDGVDRVIAGWHREFGSFYAQVYLTGDGSGWPCPSFEIGDDFDDITNPEWIVMFLDGFAIVPDDFAQTLDADAAKEGICDLPALLSIQEPRPAAYDLSDAEIPF